MCREVVLSVIMRGRYSTARANDPMDSIHKRSNCRVRSFSAAMAMATVLTVVPVGASGAETNWLDIESRIQYGYYTEDARALHGVLELLAPTDAEDATKRYYAALADYRLTQLAAATDRARAKDAAELCVSSLDRALLSRKDFADALALQSACLDVLSGLEAWRTPFSASKSGAQIEKARHLAPQNPRVLLLDAVGEYERPKSTAVDKEHALVGFRKAAAAFEAERQETEHVPGWGAAEAYVYLARCQLDRGATLEARDALERALLIAPEFAEARRLMAKITSG
jgi:tetratricopeptide (TPR) repeat protein